MGNDYIDEIIDDMLLDGSETADEIKKANEKVTNRYQEMEMKKTSFTIFMEEILRPRF